MKHKILPNLHSFSCTSSASSHIRRIFNFQAEDLMVSEKREGDQGRAKRRGKDGDEDSDSSAEIRRSSKREDRTEKRKRHRDSDSDEESESSEGSEDVEGSWK